MEQSKNSPHYAQINFTIDIFPLDRVGELSHKLTDSELESQGITSGAVFGIEGFSLEDCISKLKKVLGELRYAED